MGFSVNQTRLPRRDSGEMFSVMILFEKIGKKKPGLFNRAFERILFLRNHRGMRMALSI